MKTQYSIPTEEKEKIFHTELVKFGVEYKKAQKVARILASGEPDETLGEEEIKIAQEACKQWIKQRKLYKIVKNI
ncbi:hypothetical protein ACQFX9_12180 [Aliinostoc sp. HNIBRCY26]|uniref:hypothetical protein n=1 Tax=Aliinostoc sp. HNIBRCY26 TaxID=3418997 RepID=UPI003D057539